MGYYAHEISDDVEMWKEWYGPDGAPEEEATKWASCRYTHHAFGRGQEAGRLMMGAWMALQLKKLELDQRLMKGILPPFEMHFPMIPEEERESEFWQWSEETATEALAEALRDPQYEDVSDRWLSDLSLRKSFQYPPCSPLGR
jgi:hypothetical protein